MRASLAERAAPGAAPEQALEYATNSTQQAREPGRTARLGLGMASNMLDRACSGYPYTRDRDSCDLRSVEARLRHCPRSASACANTSSIALRRKRTAPLASSTKYSGNAQLLNARRAEADTSKWMGTCGADCARNATKDGDGGSSTIATNVIPRASNFCRSIQSCSSGRHPDPHRLPTRARSK